MGLTEEQLKRIEASRARALELQKQRSQRAASSNRSQNNCITKPLPDILKEPNTASNTHTTNSIQNGKPISCNPSFSSSSCNVAGQSAKGSHSDRTSIQQKIEENRKRAIALRDAKVSSEKKEPLTTELPENSSSSSLKLKKIKPSSEDIYNGPVHIATCCLLSHTRFVISTKFHSQLVAVIKNLPSRNYDLKTSTWSLNIEDHDNFIQSSSFLRPQVKIEPIPKFISMCLKGNKRKKIEINSSNPLLNKLLPFQKEGVEFALSLDGRALIADDMGLGKTIQALCAMQEYRSEWPLLIICPSSLRLTWSEAVTSWLPDIKYSDVNVILKGGDRIGSEKITILSYDLLTKFNLQRKFNCAIADESHFIKNAKTVRCKAAASILQNTKRCLLLSGTPALSRPIELFTQLRCVNKKLMPSYEEFGMRYCCAKKTPWGWDFNGNSNLEELNIFMSANFMIRRLKKDVLDQLPGKRRKKIVIEAKSSKSLNAAATSASTASKSTYQACLFEYYSETAMAKLPGVISYVSELLESDKKFLLFAHHKTMMGGLQDFLRKQGVQFIMIEGNTPAERRQEQCDWFQSERKCKVALLSLTAANAGSCSKQKTVYTVLANKARLSFTIWWHDVPLTTSCGQ
ncbi:hypothetical protein ACHWQZ_G013622 [Mnemiopsis leidyi]